MGKIKQGILGGFNGTVGTVVGGSWKGISYMRGKAQSIKNPNTEAQQGQRSKFSLVVAFLQQVKGFIDIGYKKQAKKLSPYNAAMSHILKKGILGSAPDYEIDFDHILLAQGSLAVAKDPVVEVTNGKIVVNWTDNSENGEGHANDKAISLLYNANVEEAVINTDAAERCDETFEQAFPESWVGDVIEAYIAFVADDGTASNSLHTKIYLSAQEGGNESDGD